MQIRESMYHSHLICYVRFCMYGICMYHSHPIPKSDKPSIIIIIIPIIQLCMLLLFVRAAM